MVIVVPAVRFITKTHAAHRSLPFGTKVRVINTRTGRSVGAINDRGPYIGVDY